MKPSIQELYEKTKQEFFYDYWLKDKDLVSEFKEENEWGDTEKTAEWFRETILHREFSKLEDRAFELGVLYWIQDALESKEATIYESISTLPSGTSILKTEEGFDVRYISEQSNSVPVSRGETIEQALTNYAHTLATHL